MRKYKFTKLDGQVTADVCGWVRSALATISNGNYIISVEKVPQKRSVSQNRLLWLWCSTIAQEWSIAAGCGFTPEQVKEAYCIKFLPTTTPLGVVGGSTSRLTTEQFTEFLEKVRADVATDYGIELPNPEDLYLLEIENSYK